MTGPEQGEIRETSFQHDAHPKLEVEIGILTMGKRTLSMALTSLLLQEGHNIRIHIVDTSETPVINRDDVVFALRLAFDRQIPCGYEHSREREKAFSAGRLKLLEALTGKHICFMDDDVVVPALTLDKMLDYVARNGVYGYLSPVCKNGVIPRGALSTESNYCPGAIFYQDDVVRKVLVDYYSTTVDVLDKKTDASKVWEVAFMTELFPALNRTCICQPDNLVYHLDYNERQNWDLLERQLIDNSTAKARELAAKYSPSKIGS
jgi:hypothetical protein